MAAPPKLPKRLEARKEPVQRRSTETVAALLEATAQVLLDRGYERMTTNDVAQRAGVAVGSLYQYFPSKDALLAGVIRRQAERELAWVIQAITEFSGATIVDAVEHGVRAVFEFRRSQAPLQGALLAQMHHLGRFPELADRVREAMEGLRPWFHAHREELGHRDPDLVLHLLVNAVHAQTHDGVLGFDERFDFDAYADEVVLLVRAYLGGVVPTTDDPCS